MQTKLSSRQALFYFLLFFCFQLISNNGSAQSKQVDLKEMKDTVNLIVSNIKTLEKASNPNKKHISDERSRLMVLLIYNSNKECGVWPSPSSKIELIEAYWKCVFEKAGFGKRFSLN